MSYLHRRAWLLGAGAALACPFAALARDAYPSRPIRFISPAAPGALSDSIPRLLAVDMATAMNTQVVVDNRPGAGGSIGTAALYSRPSDGYTLLLGTVGTMAFNPYFMPPQAYNTRRDFAGLGMAAVSPLYLVVRADSPYTSLADLVRAAKAAPGQLAYGTLGAGSTAGIASVLLARAHGLDLIGVPFPGYAPGLNELLAGRLTFLFVDGSAVSRIEQGQLRALAASTARRTERMPQVPTLRESGADIDMATWFGVYARTDTPPDILQRLRGEVRRAIERPAYRAQMVQAGLEPGSLFGEEFQRFHLAEIDRWGKALPALGIKVQN